MMMTKEDINIKTSTPNNITLKHHNTTLDHPTINGYYHQTSKLNLINHILYQQYPLQSTDISIHKHQN